MVEEKYLEALQSLGAGAHSHSERTLLHHLQGTYDQLKEWGNPEHVCLAGLFHSIYGTDAFQAQTVRFDERDKVTEIISKAAEELAFLFCVADRTSFFDPKRENGKYGIRDLVHGRVVEVDEPTIAALIEIEAANRLDQIEAVAKNIPADRIRSVLEQYFEKQELLSPAAMTAIREEHAKFAQKE